MRAIQLFEFGAAERLVLTELPVPTPGADQVLVRVEAAGVNFAETLERAGKPMGPLQLPVVMGSEVAGTVVSAGTGVNHIAVGTRVAAPLLTPTGSWYKGGYAEYAVAHAAFAVPLPPKLGSAAALALLSQGLTAYLLTHRAAPIRRGETVLVHAAAGGIGSLLVQLVRLLGAGKVIGMASTPAKRALLATLNVDVVLDSSTSDWPEHVRAATAGRGADLILESTGGLEGQRNLTCLAPFGRLVVYGISSGSFIPLGPQEWLQLLLQNQTLIGFGSFAWLTGPEPTREILEALFDLAASGKLQLTTTEFALPAAGEAHRAIEERRTSGKVVLIP
ncbi:MAG TPA: zinc-binding dehydrogenase [Steroidobacteraceae bacterium]|nr:zinc-binding dehydrogenase [Steroidobacteraceae bacterium]